MKIALVEDNGLHQAQIRQEIQNYFAELNEVCELHVFDKRVGYAGSLLFRRRL